MSVNFRRVDRRGRLLSDESNFWRLLVVAFVNACERSLRSIITSESTAKSIVLKQARKITPWTAKRRGSIVYLSLYFLGGGLTVCGRIQLVFIFCF